MSDQRKQLKVEIAPIVLANHRRAMSAAERMRRHRERRQMGLRCVTLQVWDREIEMLIQRGLLPTEMRNDLHEIREALYLHLDRTLGATP
jgi:hypothetical protein